ncbi:MAG TPA: TVP38/TMEM64 family protein [Gemmataceae bacterium]|nr:TVP38/TMEM64 family protein [Gemmataceae bacterium]
MARPKPTLIRVLLLLLLAGAAGGGLLLLREERSRQVILDFVRWARAHQWEGAAALVLIYVAACVVFVPGSLLTLGAGFAFGIGVGFVAVYIGSNLGAAAAFLLGRTLARNWIEKKVAAHPRFRAIDQAVGRQGFKIVLLLRLSPVFPFNLLNYALGLTRVSFRDYCLATLLGMVPGILLYVYLGSLITDVTQLFGARSERTVGEQVLFYAGLAATVVATLLITRTARRALAAAVPDDSTATPTLSGGNHG